MKKNKIHRVFKSFDNPLYAWEFMNGSWGNAGRSLSILCDEGFASAIIKRAIKRLFNYKFGKISLEECEEDLGIKGKFGTYLIDFNFFHHSTHTGIFYASREEEQATPSSPINGTKALFDELTEIHNFQGLIDMAIKIFSDLKDVAKKYSEGEVMELIDSCNFYGFE